MSDIIAEVCYVAGALLVLLAGVGVVRFPDVMARMHAAAKAPVLGLLLLAVGAIIQIGTVEAAVVLLLVVVLQMTASPVGSHILARSIYYRLRPPLDGPDELARDSSSDQVET